jgi:hypothetical protein
MERPFFSRNAAALFVAALLAGCGGAPGAVPSRVLASSWIGPEARGKDLLYVSSQYDCAVYVFTYPRGKFVQTLTSATSGSARPLAFAPIEPATYS